MKKVIRIITLLLFSISMVHCGKPIGPNDHLVILTNSNEYPRVVHMAGSDKDTSAIIKMFDIAEFPDKLNAKMLAGDRDYDLVVLGTQSDYVAEELGAIIRYGQYVDLYGDAELKSNLDEMIPGAKEILETDGQLVALPLEFQCRIPGIDMQAARKLNLTVDANGIQNAFTTEDARKIADVLKNQTEYAILSNGTGGLKTRCYIDLLNNILMAKFDFSDPQSEPIREEAAKYMAVLDEYRQAGILTGDKPLFVSLYDSDLNRFAEILNDSPDIVPCLFPTLSADDKETIRVSVVMIMNPNSKNKDLAFDFLTELTSEKNRYDLLVYSNPFWPDLTRYYMHGSKYLSKEYDDIAETMEKILESYYRHCSVSTTGSTLTTWEVMMDFCEGNVSAEEAANEIFKQIIYQRLG
ncbi:MAG: hypothetical protein IKH41_01860 [Clostridia bacterium]|nr:hypothetical protein [Clostridia bacterium]